MKRSASGTLGVRQAIETALDRNRAYVKTVEHSLLGTANVYSDIIDRMDIDDSKKGVLIETFQNIIEQAIAMVEEMPWFNFGTATRTDDLSVFVAASFIYTL